MDTEDFIKAEKVNDFAEHVGDAFHDELIEIGEEEELYAAAHGADRYAHWVGVLDKLASGGIITEGAATAAKERMSIDLKDWFFCGCSFDED